MPFDACVFDRVFCVNAMHHFADPLACLAEVRRVLCAEGAIMVIGIDPHLRSDWWWIYDYFDGALERDLSRYPAVVRIRSWMEEAGFGRCTTVEVQHWLMQVKTRHARAEGYLETTANLTAEHHD